MNYAGLPAAPEGLKSAGLMTHTNIEYTSTQLIVELNTGVVPGEDVR